MTRQNFRFFWGKEDPESNFYPCLFRWKNQIVNCSEQAYMYEKALYFHDWDIAEKILLLTNPSIIKKAGKLVNNFDVQKWSLDKDFIMESICFEKFAQVSHLHNHLIKDTDFLVEASPYDRYWGIGLSKSEALKVPVGHWPGKNRLGFVLMKVRDRLLNGR